MICSKRSFSISLVVTSELRWTTPCAFSQNRYHPSTVFQLEPLTLQPSMASHSSSSYQTILEHSLTISITIHLRDWADQPWLSNTFWIKLHHTFRDCSSRTYEGIEVSCVRWGHEFDDMGSSCEQRGMNWCLPCLCAGHGDCPSWSEIFRGLEFEGEIQITATLQIKEFRSTDDKIYEPH
jgi:hypothetical protein